MREVRVLGPRGVVLRALEPQTRRERMRGLRGRPSLDVDRALLVERTRSVHTFGMGFPIKIAFLGDDHVVRKVLLVSPSRLVLPRPGVRHVLECTEGADLRPGDRLRIVVAD